MLFFLQELQLINIHQAVEIYARFVNEMFQKRKQYHKKLSEVLCVSIKKVVFLRQH